jgi:hypothetical protein
MPDAFVPIDDYGFPPQHGQDVAFGADVRARCTADAIIRVNVRVLRLRAFGVQLALFGSRERLLFPLLEFSQVQEQGEEDDSYGNKEGKEIFHGQASHSIAHQESQGDMDKREDGEGITERPVDDVPEVENLPRAREKKDASGEGGLPFGNPDGLFQVVVPGGQQAAEG